MAKTRVLWWDWREQPDLEELKKIITELSGGALHVHEANTHSDQYAFAISTEPLDQEKADAAFVARWEGEE